MAPDLSSSTNETRFHLRVRLNETDLMGIVHHANYLKYAEAGRVEYLRRRGVEYRGFIERGLHMPVVEAKLRYHRPARFDEALVVVVRLGVLTRVTIRFDYSVMREGDGAPALLAEGYTLLACVDENQRPRRIPADVAALLQAGESVSAAEAGSNG